MFRNTYNLLRDNEILTFTYSFFLQKIILLLQGCLRSLNQLLKREQKFLRDLGELILKKVKSKLSLPREILIEELNSGLAIGYDQNYIKHKVPLVGVPVGEVIRV